MTEGPKVPFIWGARFRQPRGEPVILQDSTEVPVTQSVKTTLASQQLVAPPNHASRPTGNTTPRCCPFLCQIL